VFQFSIIKSLYNGYYPHNVLIFCVFSIDFAEVFIHFYVGLAFLPKFDDLTSNGRDNSYFLHYPRPDYGLYDFRVRLCSAWAKSPTCIFKQASISIIRIVSSLSQQLGYWPEYDNSFFCPGWRVRVVTVVINGGFVLFPFETGFYVKFVEVW
jgi:hypothetical protein